MSLDETVGQIGPISVKAMEQAKTRWSHVAKPLGSLGLLEEAVIKVAGIQGKEEIKIDKKALVIMCADNGVVEEQVTQTGQEVTQIVTENFTKGRACVCMMAERAGVQVFPVDIGVAKELTDCGHKYPLLRRKVAYGTRNLHKEQAMSRAETEKAIGVGIQLAGELKAQGYQLLAVGEMGIGNTTTSSAVSSVLLGVEPCVLTGRGAGLSDEGLKQKIRIIEEAIALHRPDPEDAVDVLSKVGGLDLAGLAGVFLGGAIYHIPVVLDGVITASAALAASVLCRNIVSYLLASHVSAEPAGQMILDRLGLSAPIHGRMCLGEGTGAMAYLPMLSMAADIYLHMSTFENIQIEEYQEYPKGSTAQ